METIPQPKNVAPKLGFHPTISRGIPCAVRNLEAVAGHLFPRKPRSRVDTLSRRPSSTDPKQM